MLLEPDEVVVLEATVSHLPLMEISNFLCSGNMSMLSSIMPVEAEAAAAMSEVKRLEGLLSPPLLVVVMSFVVVVALCRLLLPLVVVVLVLVVLRLLVDN